MERKKLILTNWQELFINEQQKNSMNFYQHKKIEAYLNHNWSKVTNCDFVSEKKNFAIVLPPPNVTGTLHLGHA